MALVHDARRSKSPKHTTEYDSEGSRGEDRKNLYDKDKDKDEDNDNDNDNALHAINTLLNHHGGRCFHCARHIVDPHLSYGMDLGFACPNGRSIYDRT
jgi:hypothetical protein